MNGFFERATDANGNALLLTGDNIVLRARTFIGTPWHHAGRLKGRNGGIDCSGLLIGVMAELGIAIIDDVNYTHGDEFNRMTSHMDQYARRLRDNEHLRNGDVLVFRGGRISNHCGIYCKDTDSMIHAFRPLGCVEQPMDERWTRLTAVRYRYKHIQKGPTDARGDT